LTDHEGIPLHLFDRGGEHEIETGRRMQRLQLDPRAGSLHGQQGLAHVDRAVRPAPQGVPESGQPVVHGRRIVNLPPSIESRLRSGRVAQQHPDSQDDAVRE
jgi:hypothetical protein